MKYIMRYIKEHWIDIAATVLAVMLAVCKGWECAVIWMLIANYLALRVNQAD